MRGGGRKVKEDEGRKEDKGREEMKERKEDDGR